MRQLWWQAFRVRPRIAVVLLLALLAGALPVPSLVAPALAQAPALTVPKWLDLPNLDGACSDTAYAAAPAATAQMLNAAGLPVGNVRILHSTLDAYFCFSGLPVVAGERVTVRVDSNGSGGANATAGDYAFSVGSDGSLDALQGNGAGGYAPITVPAADFVAAVTTTGDQLGAELRISLEWLGGWAHTIRANLAVEPGQGPSAITQWPGTAARAVPSTWSSLTFGPLYAAGLNAGSAFVDGANGYLVIPYSPALNPAEITLEAWVKVVGDDCGTLAGNGQGASYWLGLCDAIRFSSHSAASTLTGNQALGEGWHHVAVSQDQDGLRTYYLDGKPDVVGGWEPVQEPNEPPGEVPDQVGASDRMLRIGSDRDVIASLNYLHAYVRELRIWDHVRSQREIAADAFHSLTGSEPGLAGLWPFAHGLQDLSHGQDAGLVGNASLARETSDISAFPADPVPPPYTYPAAPPQPAWDPRLPRLPSAQITIDGICKATEYGGATHMMLEPDRLHRPALLLASDGLYLCTGMLWGSVDPADANVTLLLDRDGGPRQAPGPADLRVRVAMDGSVSVATGDGSGWGGSGPDGIVAHVIRGTRLAPQEDVRPVDAPWWSAEVRIPLAALGSLSQTGGLRAALRYDGRTPPAGALVDTAQGTDGPAIIPPGLITTGQWPAAFDEALPASWGDVEVEPLHIWLPALMREGTRPASSEPMPADAATREAAQSDAGDDSGEFVPVRIASLPAGPADYGWPRPQPTASDFDNNCTFGWNAALLTNPDVKWLWVDPAAYRFVKATGTVAGLEYSFVDSPFIHESHDFGLRLAPDPGSQWIMLDSSPEEVVETETKYLPAERRPAKGDHVTVIGQWIYDCGHAPKTEIHPVTFIASDHTVLRPTGIPGTRPRRVQIARVSLNNWQGPATHGSINLLAGAPYTFDMKMPAYYPQNAKSMPFLRVSKGLAAGITATYDPSWEIMHVSITPVALIGDFFWEMEAGWLDNYAETCGANCTPAEEDNYQLTLDSMTILYDHEDVASGQWFSFVTVNGEARQMFWGAHMNDQFPPVDLSQYMNTDFAITGFPGDKIRMSFYGYEDDDDILGGEPLYTTGWDQPLEPGSYTSPVPGNTDWVLHYHITKGGTAPGILSSSQASFWQSRLANETTSGLSLGTVHVPAAGQPAQTTTASDYISDPGINHDQVKIMAPDKDHVYLAFDEFADATFSISTGSASLTRRELDTTYWTPELKALFTAKAYALDVQSKNGQAGDLPYTVNVTRSWHAVPDDWGEGLDAGGGRPVDLVTPDPKTDVYNQTMLGGHPYQRRTLGEDWAWQELPADVDTYVVSFPPQTVTPVPGRSCPYDLPGKLTLSAYQQQLHVVETNQTGLDSREVDLTSGALHGGGTLHVQVASATGHRDWYYFEAQWEDGVYYNSGECALIAGVNATQNRVAGMNLVEQGALIFGGRGVYLPYPAPEFLGVDLSARGGYRQVSMVQGTSFNALFSGPADRPFAARLFDANNVLLGEMAPLTGQAQQEAKAPAGKLAQGRLNVSDLTTGQTYLLQFVPGFDPGSGFQAVPIGMDQQAP